MKNMNEVVQLLLSVCFSTIHVDSTVLEIVAKT